MDFLLCIRRNLALSQEELAHILGISARTVSRWEQGRVAPSSSSLRQLATFLGPRSKQALPQAIKTRYLALASSAVRDLHRGIRDGLVKKICDNYTPLGTVCSDCGEPAIQYDHRDYFKPLVVEPVCNQCNQRRGLAILTFLDHHEEWQDFDWRGAGQQKVPKRILSGRRQ